MANNKQFLTINSNKIVSTKKDVIIGEDNTDILNINSKLSFSGRDNIILPTPISSDSNKLLKINNSGDTLELDMNGVNNNSRLYIVCSELSSDNWGDITPVDGELTVYPGQDIMFYINASGSRSSGGSSTWTFKYKVDSDSTFTNFNYPTNSEFKHYFNASNDNQHRSATFYFRNYKSSNVVFKKFQVTFNGSLDNSEDFVTITGVVLNTKEYPLAGAGGTAAFTAYGSNNLSGNDWGNVTKIHDNDIYDTNSSSGGLYSTANATTSTISYEFTTPQIITKYRIWPRHNTVSGARRRNLKVWELRAATDKATYDAGTYTQLDSQSLSGADTDDGASTAWKCDLSQTELSSSNLTASNNTHLANEYNLSKIGAYKYYLLYITDNFGGTLHQLAEWALYQNTTLYKQVSSFKPDIPLAGAGGTTSFTATSSTILGSAYPLIPAVYNNIIKRNLGENQQTLLVFSNPESGWTPPANVAVSNPFIAYEFAVPQIVTSYRIWHAQDQNSGDYIPKEWELRASADSSTYVASNSNTYTLLDSQTNQSFTLWSTTGQLAASDNLDLSNLYHINTVGAFKYFVLYFKDSNDSNKRLIGVNEWALYGDGLILPDQTNNANKKLITNGINLEWSDDVEPILTGSGSSHEIIKVNSNSNGLEYGGTDAVKIPCANNLFRPYTPKNGMMRYNNQSNYYEVYNNGWHKIITKDMYETSIGLLNRDFSETDFNDKINNSYGYYVHGRNNPPLFSGSKLAHNIYHSLTFDTVLYDDSPLQNMADISNNRINIKKTGDYLINYKSSFNLTNTTQQLTTNFKIKINKNNSLLYESNLIKASSGLINNKTHYFIDDFNYITSLAEGDYITILLQHQTSSNNLMLSYDYIGGYSDTSGYNIDENYNYEYMKYIASQLIVKKILIV